MNTSAPFQVSYAQPHITAPSVRCGPGSFENQNVFACGSNTAILVSSESNNSNNFGPQLKVDTGVEDVNPYGAYNVNGVIFNYADTCKMRTPVRYVCAFPISPKGRYYPVFYIKRSRTTAYTFYPQRAAWQKCNGSEATFYSENGRVYVSLN